jgi:hypothetical protein
MRIIALEFKARSRGLDKKQEEKEVLKKRKSGFWKKSIRKT